MSEILGKKVAEKAHPIKRLDPINPILAFGTQSKLRTTNQLWSEVESVKLYL